MTSNIDRERVVAAVRELLTAIGEDPDRAELASTPDRVANAYEEFFAGVGVDPLDEITELAVADADTGELVLMRGIDFRSVCEHHLLPFRGRAHIAYRPHAKILGLGTIARLVDIIASRPQLQERLGEQVAETMNEALAPEGVLVVLEARHGCVSDRGANQASARITTVASRGVLSEPAARAEAISLIGAATSGADPRAGEARSDGSPQ